VSELEPAIDRLYAVPLESFVAERTRLAKDLRSGGDRAAAGKVAKLPKPTAAAWALNHVARQEPGAIADWLRTTAALRDASNHAAEVGGDALRAAMAAHRAATASLMEVVRDRAQPGGRPLSEAMLDRVRTLLQSATADEQLAGRLEAGRITEDKGPAESAPGREPPTDRPAGKPPPAPKRDAEAGARAEAAARAARAVRVAKLERQLAAAEEKVKRLHKETARREVAADSADERLEQALRAVRRFESEAAAARDAVKDAEQAAVAAERELQQLHARMRDAGVEDL
jgi:hypothetical protein